MASICWRLVPTAVALSAFVLTILTLFSGDKPGVLTHNDILTVDITGLHPRLMERPHFEQLFRRENPDCSGSGILAHWCEQMTEAAGTAPADHLSSNNGTVPEQNAPSNSTNDGNEDDDDTLPPVVIKKRYVDFYSHYALAVCEGFYSETGRRIVTKCHSYFDLDYPSNIPELLNNTIKVNNDAALESINALLVDNDDDGRNKTVAAPIPYPLPESLTQTLRALTPLFKATAIILAIAAGFVFLSAIASGFAAPVKSDRGIPYTWAVWTNVIFSFLAFFFLALGGLVGSVGGKVNEGNVKHQGTIVAVTAYAGTGWVSMVWASAAIMLCILMYWTGRALRMRRKLKQEQAQAAEEAAAPPQPAPAMPMAPGVVPAMPAMQAAYVPMGYHA